MASIYSILNEIAETSSRKEKEAILNSYKDNVFLRDIIQITYDPRLNFYIRNLNFLYIEGVEGHASDEELYNAVAIIKETLSTRKLTGNSAKEWLVGKLSEFNETDVSVLTRVIGRDLRCGASASTFNKIWPNLIYQHPYMRCAGLSEKILSGFSLPCYSQEKLDGLYVDIIVSKDNVLYSARSGEDLKLNDKTKDECLLGLVDEYDEYVLQGELLVLDEGGKEYLPREESNGYVNSLDVDLNRLVFVLWDCIPLQDHSKKVCKEPYQKRFGTCKDIVVNLPSGYVSVESITCESKEDIIDHFAAMRTLGREGTVIKDMTGEWAHTTSKKQVKIKVIIEIDLKIVGFKPGNGKFEGMVGSLTCQSEDGLLEVGVSGMNDKTREYVTENIDSMIQEGQIATVKVNGVMKNKNGGLHSAFLPRLKELRMDKTEADSFERIVEQEESFTDVLKLIKV